MKSSPMIDLPPAPARDYEAERTALVQQAELATPANVMRILEEVAKFSPPVVSEQVETFITASGACDGDSL